jgi:hypothetical protein
VQGPSKNRYENLSAVVAKIFTSHIHDALESSLLLYNLISQKYSLILSVPLPSGQSGMLSNKEVAAFWNIVLM